MKKRLCLTVFGLSLAAALAAFPGSAQAGELEPGGNDTKAINAELEDTHYVKLQAGKTYHLSNYITVNSGDTIDATGATILVDKAIIRNVPTSTGYDSTSGVNIKGGVWKCSSKNKGGWKTTSISFAHAKNIKLENMELYATNYQGHAIELVACKDVTVKGCKITAQGKPVKNSVEEMLQIDLATPRTAPFLESSKLQNGKASKNIYVIGNTIKGSRAVCANYAAKEAKYRNRYHENIVIKNNKLTGVTAQALSLYNTISGTVSGNKIVTNSPRLTESYSDGCTIQYMGKVKSTASKSKFTISKNKIYGGRNGLNIYSHSSSKFGKVTLKSNKIYSKKGKSKALLISRVRKVSKKGNKLYKW